MSLHRFPVSLNALRALAVAGAACGAASAYTPASYRYHSFFAGATVGILVVLAAMLFRAHPAEVEDEGPDTQA
jgi:bacteriorhodopsin